MNRFEVAKGHVAEVIPAMAQSLDAGPIQDVPASLLMETSRAKESPVRAER